MSNPFANWTQADVDAFNRKRRPAAERFDDTLRGPSYEAVQSGAESELLHAAIKYLRERGYFIGWAATCLKSTYTVGWPDITFCHKGQMVCIELKTRIGKVRIEQEAAHMMLRKNGALVFVCRSMGDVREVVKTLEKME